MLVPEVVTPKAAKATGRMNKKFRIQRNMPP